MKEGWFNDDYWSLCEDEKEAQRLTATYGLADYLPGYFIVGFRGWDDFILADSESRHFLVPTLPLEHQKLSPFEFPAAKMQLEPDERFTSKIKWYVKPILFGGDPAARENMTWLSLDDHVKAVKWWNRFYFDKFARSR